MTTHHHSKTDQENPQQAADAATATLREIEKGLPMKEPITLAEKVRSTTLLRIGHDAMSIAVDLALRHPDRFGDFDVAMVQSAASYEAAMLPFAQKCRDLASRIEDSIVAAKIPASQQVLAIYAAAKGLARFKKGESMLPQVRQLKALLRTRVKHRKTAEQTPAPAPAPAAEAAAPAAPTK